MQPTTATALGARIDEVGKMQAYAPFGLNDLFSLTIRPNKKIISEEIFYEKANKWRAKWPELQVVE
ncbi:nucleotidyltransferase family protein [Paenibacillus sp. MMS18-CY102]|uniref:nucleotidyltransferase family protein n=1 Tax=Paenibacillus sp. MMS18-CY102 TaxID=2682849 RepID=UPI00192265D4|nr:nucleotidyltransferase family protein [Paenibacillus sp. MMS18-CY102]